MSAKFPPYSSLARKLRVKESEVPMGTDMAGADEALGDEEGGPYSARSSTTRIDQAIQRWGRVRTHVIVLHAAKRLSFIKPRNKFRTASIAITALERLKALPRANLSRHPRSDPEVAEDWRRARASPKPSGFGISAEEVNFLAKWHHLEGYRELGGAPALADMLRTNVERGIQETEVQERQDAYGTNTFPKKEMKPFIQFVVDAFKDPTLMILTACAIASVIVGIIANGTETGWYDGVAISFAVILVVLVTSVSDYKQALQFRGISEAKDNIFIKASRDGSRSKISIWDLVVGDIVHLHSGDQVPGDGVLIEGHHVLIDESSMTGESLYVKKDAVDRPFLMSGCKVADGQGKMLIIAVGANTEWGKIMVTLSDDTAEETPLQTRLNGVATFIGAIGLVIAVLVLIILLIRFVVDVVQKPHKYPYPADKVKEIVKIVEIAVAIVVVSVPEGLPLAVTITLAYSMRKMMNDNAFVRKLAACETMGSATSICSDKTGTLTKNEMEVVASWVAGKERPIEQVKDFQKTHAEFYKILLDGIVHNVEGDVNDEPGVKEPKVSAGPTDSAVLKWGLTIGMRFRQTKQKVMKIEPFSSTKKCAAVAMRIPGKSSVRIHWKGASEIVLRRCINFFDADVDDTRPITNPKREELLGIIEAMATASLRTLVLASREVTDGIPTTDREVDAWLMPEEGLTLLAIIGIKDPCRPGVQLAVRTCQLAGVKVRMVTGDNLITARAIATECGIYTEDPESIILEGSTFRRLSPDQKREMAKQIVVMARSSPSDKLELVKALREKGEVVAVTGDGTNDAPALHEADIGLAMGISGTEVAKDSADIIILDDNFASIVKVVRWGRSVYANTQKFIQFQLTVNVVALTLNFIAALLGDEIPLTTVQLLWVNLIMDTLGALALATEPPHDKLLLRSPVGRTEALITNQMWHNILGVAAYQLVVLMVLQYRGADIFGVDDDNVIRSMIFNAFVFCQLFNEINSRKPDELNVFDGVFSNPIFLGVLFTTAFVQALIIQFANTFANTTKLDATQWSACIVIGLVGMPVAALVKMIPPSNTPYFERKKTQ